MENSQNEGNQERRDMERGDMVCDKAGDGKDIGFVTLDPGRSEKLPFLNPYV